MVYSGRFDQKVEAFSEDELRKKINKTYLELEIRITVDHLLKHDGATLVNQRGQSIEVHPETVNHYAKLTSLINDYTSLYGANPELESMNNKWGTTENRYH